MKKSVVISLVVLATISTLQPLNDKAATAVYWDFGAAGSGGSLAPASNPWSGLTVTDWAVGNVRNVNPILAPNSISSGYTTAAGFSASGATNAEAAIFGGALNPTSAPTNTYFSTAFTLDMSSPIVLTLTDVSFGSRSTGTGPTAFSIFLSTDGFTSDFEQVGTTVTAAADSTYHAIDISSLTFDIDPGQTISLRLYGSSGTGTSSSANWRVDDFAANFSSSPVSTPEPSTFALSAFGGIACFFAVRRKK